MELLVDFLIITARDSHIDIGWEAVGFPHADHKVGGLVWHPVIIW